MEIYKVFACRVQEGADTFQYIALLSKLLLLLSLLSFLALASKLHLLFCSLSEVSSFFSSLESPPSSSLLVLFSLQHHLAIIWIPTHTCIGLDLHICQQQQKGCGG